MYTMYGGEESKVDGEETEIDGDGNPITTPKGPIAEQEKGPIGLGIDSAKEEIQNGIDFFTGSSSDSTEEKTDKPEEEKSLTDAEGVQTTPPNNGNNQEYIELKDKVVKLEEKVEDLQVKLEDSHQKNVELLERLVEKSEQQHATPTVPPSEPPAGPPFEPPFEPPTESSSFDMPYNASEESGITSDMQATKTDLEPTPNVDYETEDYGQNTGGLTESGNNAVNEPVQQGDSLVDRGEKPITELPSTEVSGQPTPAALPAASSETTPTALPAASSETTSTALPAASGQPTPLTGSSGETTQIGGKSKRRRRTIRKSRKQHKYRYRYVY
jgi:hypothetical protein